MELKWMLLEDQSIGEKNAPWEINGFTAYPGDPTIALRITKEDLSPDEGGSITGLEIVSRPYIIYKDVMQAFAFEFAVYQEGPLAVATYDRKGRALDISLLGYGPPR